jgi:hypothetical protein
MMAPYVDGKVPAKCRDFDGSVLIGSRRWPIYSNGIKSILLEIHPS